jgi:hypothetical protein
VSDLADKTCIPCRGGVPALKGSIEERAAGVTIAMGARVDQPQRLWTGSEERLSPTDSPVA